MKPITIFFIAIISMFFSCEQESIQTLEEVNLSHEIENSPDNTKAFAFIRRLKLRKKRTSGYRVSVISNYSTDEVAYIELAMEPQNGVIPNATIMHLEPKNTNENGETKYVYNSLYFEGEDPAWLSFMVTITPKNSAGEDVAEPETMYITVADTNDGLNIKQPFLKINEDEETFSFLSIIAGELNQEVAAVDISLFSEDGGSDTETFSLELFKEKPNKKVFLNQELLFSDATNVVDMLYLAEITLLDSNGDELDYAEFRIVGLE